MNKENFKEKIRSRSQAQLMRDKDLEGWTYNIDKNLSPKIKVMNIIFINLDL